MTRERAIEALYTVRAYYASLTAGYPKGKDCKGIGDVMCSEIANSCLMAIEALEKHPCEDCISRQAVLEMAYDMSEIDGEHFTEPYMVVDVADIRKLSSVKPHHTGHWTDNHNGTFVCDRCGCKHSKSNYCPNCGAEMEVQNED